MINIDNIFLVMKNRKPRLVGEEGEKQWVWIHRFARETLHKSKCVLNNSLLLQTWLNGDNMYIVYFNYLYCAHCV